MALSILTSMPEPYFPPGATPEQCRRIVAACARILEPERTKPQSKVVQGNKAEKPFPGGTKRKASKP